MLTDMIRETNALGQAVVVEIVGVFADKSTIPSDDIAALASVIAEKGFKLRQTSKVQFTLLKLMECDIPDPVVEQLTKQFSSRIKKIPNHCAQCLTEAFVQFGMAAMKASFPLVRDRIAVLFKSSDAAVCFSAE